MRSANCIACIVAVGLIALRQFLFQRSCLYWGDIELYFAPMQSLLHTQLAHGAIPLWNPYILCGQPFVGNPQMSVLYPASLLAGIVSPWSFLSVDAALHLILGGCFFFLLVRDFGVSRPSSMLSSLSFMLGGYFITKVQFPNMVQAIAYAPAIIWLAGRLPRAPGAAPAVGLGVLIGLQLLAAHAQIAMMTDYMAAGYALFRALRARHAGTRVHWPAIFGWGCAALALGCAIDGGQLLPVLELWRNSDRQTLSLGIANRFTMLPGEQIGFIDPYAFGSPYFGNFSEIGNYWEPACYVGIAPFVAMVWASVVGVRQRLPDILLLICVFVLSVWLAEGCAGGLYTAAFYAVPGLKAFHDPARLLIGACIAAPILAGLGFDRLLGVLRGKRRAFAAVVLAAAIAIDLGAFDTHVYPFMPVSRIRADIQAARKSAQQGAVADTRIIFSPDNRASWTYFIDYDNFHRLDRQYVPALLATHTPNIGMLTGIADAGGYEPEPPRGAGARFIAAFNQAQRGNFALADRLDVGRTFLVADGRGRSGVTGPSGFFARRRMIVRVNPEARVLSRAYTASGTYLAVRDIGPDVVRVATPAFADPTSITVTDTDMPGWRAYDGDRKPAIIRTRDGLQRIALPASAQGGVLELRYEPDSWRVGLYLTLIGWAIACAYGAFAVSSKRRARGARRSAAMAGGRPN